ncbi:hypothetical protein Phum_PHUM018990 [Pediculus humanus corporis]|uniref:Transmembrane protein n=1 Tax=Pediculus humanus subsp. corporis TaxID=121224 RepID=E0V9P2_PEDHC|nr:uncharacterized protein Phum_PHUM018990 [Pediculus humanus corporis]EEB10111.1 hypothetical protein Phum_PHUM018990 [Pediculus humanus corporis]
MVKVRAEVVDVTLKNFPVFVVCATVRGFVVCLFYSKSLFSTVVHFFSFFFLSRKIPPRFRHT